MWKTRGYIRQRNDGGIFTSPRSVGLHLCVSRKAQKSPIGFNRDISVIMLDFYTLFLLRLTCIAGSVLGREKERPSA